MADDTHFPSEYAAQKHGLAIMIDDDSSKRMRVEGPLMDAGSHVAVVPEGSAPAPTSFLEVWRMFSPRFALDSFIPFV